MQDTSQLEQCIDFTVHLPQVLDGCPWLLPKPLQVLAVLQLAAPHAAMFTLQTRVQQQQLESELSKVPMQMHQGFCGLAVV